ncbi:MAG: hypothetical protein ACP6IY_13915 [Promethearchaeia archaeon]
MKSKYLVASLIIISFIMSAVSIRAADYEFQIKKDDSATYELKSFDEDLAKEYLGSDDIEDIMGDGAEVGAKQMVKIKDVDETEYYSMKDGSKVKIWNVTAIRWDWTTDTKDFEDEDKADDPYWSWVYQDPDDWGSDVSGMAAIMLSMSGIPTPVADYLKAIDWEDDVSIKDTTAKVKTKDYDTNKTIYYEITWDAGKGYLANFKVLDGDDEKVIYEIAVQAIPGYELPILLGLSALSIIGIIYALRKKY